MNEAEKLYIGYSNKLRNVIERFDIQITQLKCERAALENYKRDKKSYRNATCLFMIFGAVLLVLAVALFLYIKIKINYLGTHYIILIVCGPIVIIYNFIFIRKFLKARKDYNSYMDIGALENPKNGYINNFYWKSQRYTKCIKVLEERMNEYIDILEKLKMGVNITEAEIEKLDNMSGQIYNIPELGYTYHEI
ncbi:MAG: hypothetical protein IJZ25_03475 [Lachnospiraceae bacterium]|nr:hypothetical protein [Lachnospiraceae bacterium]